MPGLILSSTSSAETTFSRHEFVSFVAILVTSGWVIHVLETVSKGVFWFLVKADANFKPEEYYRISRI